MTLDLGIRIEDPDAFYETLADKLNRAQDPTAVLTRALLILANQVGEQAVLMAALELAATPDDGAADEP